MKILLTGASGQVGHELLRSLRPFGEIVAPGRDRMDLADPSQMRRFIRDTAPKMIINAAAYTDVERAETEPGIAMRINADAPAIMAEEAGRIGAMLIHYSTDYVFDGAAAMPYREHDPAEPVNAYGRSKLAGERAIIAAGIPHLILRTGWVYGLRGRNFLLSILHLARARDTLRVVDDQFGTPTWCRTVADITAQLLSLAHAAPDAPQWWREHGGVLHLTARGSVSRAGFARRIIELAGLPDKVNVAPISTAEFPSRAARPNYSVLDTARLQALCTVPEWEEALGLCMHRSG